ncbi:MAG: hypothetical protein QXL78_04210 [Methanocellales archaeon]
MAEREIAWRVFAAEFNQSNLRYSEGSALSPNYIITPSGAKCNRVYIVGVVTEVENIGHGEELWRSRIADPTGAFAVYAGQFQPDIAIFLSEVEIPSFLAVVGKVRIFEPEAGAFYTTIRPEEINIVDAKVRDMWVLTTAERTLERINHLKAALDSKLTGESLVNYLLTRGARKELASGIAQAIAHYKTSEESLQKLRQMVIDALESLAGEIEIEGSNKNKEVIYSILSELDRGEGASYEEIINAAEQRGLDERAIEGALRELMNEGRCYEPRIGILRKV